MQLYIRGQACHVIECDGNESIAKIKEQVAVLENLPVEKQDKKKKKTGRAKRRIQYNRRFVNVVQGFGRRRGPNANS
uniref:40S ribosomal protein S30 n=2 Tax=Timema TaxID=61471 RepID=A0A7R9P8K0_TIMCA|nr:unnamed protein product [Timema poppensis]CAD7573571.1 unnamed protein product [Timema californicum]